MKDRIYRVLLRDHHQDVFGDEYSVEAPPGVRPSLTVLKKGKVVAIFPEGDWHGFLVVKVESKP